MENEKPELNQLNSALIWSGFKHLTPISFFVTAFGAAFGLAAQQEGLSDSVIIFMSSVVFAGAAQFAALDLWGTEIPVFTMMITVFAINARHLLMGATLYPWLSPLPPVKRYGVMAVVSDANWALSLQSFKQGKPGLGLLFGGGLSLWFFWVFGTWLGTYFGNVIDDLNRYGLDMVMGCFLLAMVMGGEKNSRILFIWVVAGMSSWGAYRYLPENSHVIVGAFAGGLAGLVWGDSKR